MPALNPEDNVVLIGMPGVGKSTVGVLLAKVMSRDFIDTDVVIQARECRTLQDIIDQEGLASFRLIEERHILMSAYSGTVIATGGSVVYSGPAMEYLRERGVVVFLDVSLGRLKERLTNLAVRGVAMGAGQSLESLYEERMPLYRRFADVTVDCEDLNHEQVVERVARVLEFPSA